MSTKAGTRSRCLHLLGFRGSAEAVRVPHFNLSRVGSLPQGPHLTMKGPKGSRAAAPPRRPSATRAELLPTPGLLAGNSLLRRLEGRNLEPLTRFTGNRGGRFELVQKNAAELLSARGERRRAAFRVL